MLKLMLLKWTNRPTWLRIAVGILLPSIAALIRLEWLQAVELRVAFVTFYPAVAAAALYGRFGAGLVATLVSAALADYFWITPVGSLYIAQFADRISMVIFLASSVFVSYLAEATYRAQDRASRAEGQALHLAELERAAAALRESEARLKMAMDLAKLAPWDYDVQSGAFNFDEQFYALYGTTSRDQGSAPMPAEVYAGRFIPPEESRIVAEEIAKALSANDPDFTNQLEHRIIRADGEERHIVVRYGVVCDQGGKVVRLRGTDQDITERKRFEEAWRSGEERFRKLFEESPIGICFLGKEREITLTNKRYRDFLGYNEAEIKDLGPWGLLHPDDLEESMSLSAKLRSGEIPVFHKEQRFIHKDGRVLWADTQIVALHDRNGDLVQTIAWVQDITGPKRAELRREANQEVLRVLNEVKEIEESIPRIVALLKTKFGFDVVGVRMVDDHDYPYLSQTGFPEDLLAKENSLVQRTSEGGIHRDQDGKARLECTCGAVIEGVIGQDNSNFTPFGSFWTNDSYLLLDLPAWQDPRNNPRNRCIHHGYASVALVPIRARDKNIGLIQINDRRKDMFTPGFIHSLESMATHIGAAMMREISRQETELLTNQLHQAQKLESIGRLAGGVAHDFNNMLGVIIGHADLALQEDLSQGVRDSLSEILNAGLRSADLTRQLLAFARKQAVSPIILDLNDTISGMHKMLQRLIGEDVDIAWLPAEGLWPVMLDPGQVDQILVNLCINARDAISGIGKVTIETGNTFIDDAYCDLHPGIAPGEFVTLAVSDSGCGIDAEDLGQIFEPFFTTKAVGKGTGLGLATVYGIVKQNNGFIDVYSDPGRGTTFRICIPRAERRTDEIAPAYQERNLRGRETVLLVEDEESILALGRTILERHGYEVLATGKPTEALEMAKNYPGPIHLLITDVVMPGINGKDLRDALTALRPDIKGIFMSGYTAKVIAHQGILEENVNFLHKPFSVQNLLEKVRDVLEG